MPAIGKDGSSVAAYKEITSDEEVAGYLRAASLLSTAATAADERHDGLTEDILAAAGFEAFATYLTHRAKYRYVPTFSSMAKAKHLQLWPADDTLAVRR